MSGTPVRDEYLFLPRTDPENTRLLMFYLRRVVLLAVFLSLSVCYPFLVIIGAQRFREARVPHVAGRMDLAITVIVLLAAFGIIVETGIRLLPAKHPESVGDRRDRIGIWLTLSLYAVLMALWVGSLAGTAALLAISAGLGVSYVRSLRGTTRG